MSAGRILEPPTDDPHPPAFWDPSSPVQSIDYNKLVGLWVPRVGPSCINVVPTYYDQNWDLATTDKKLAMLHNTSWGNLGQLLADEEGRENTWGASGRSPQDPAIFTANVASKKRMKVVDGHLSISIYLGSASYGHLVCDRYAEGLANMNAASARTMP